MSSLPSILADLGHRLEGAADAVALDEPVSALDKVRACAFSNDCSPLWPAPPVLQDDALAPTDMFVFRPPNGRETFFNSNKALCTVPSLCVVGGAMLQSTHVSFPVTVLYSKERRALFVHAEDAPLPALEADFYDSSFAEHHPWEQLLCESGACEIVQWRRQAAVETVTAGLSNTPTLLLSADEPVVVVRYGVGPLLSLRCVANKAEFEEVCTHVASMLQLRPCASRDLMDEARRSRNIVTSIILESREPRLLESVSTPPLEQAEEVCKRASLSWVASLVLHGALDDAVDSNGEIVSEQDTSLPYSERNERLFAEVAAKERAVVEAACTADRSSDLQCFTDIGYTLRSVMHGLGRAYTTMQISDLEASDARSVVGEVIGALFAASDVEAAKSNANKCTPSVATIHSSVAAVGRVLCDSQAVLVASRDPDGRFTTVELVGNNRCVKNVPKRLFSRLVLFPWVRVVIVDRAVVSELLVRSPVQLGERQPFMVRRDLCADAAPSLQTIDALRCQVSELKTAVDSVGQKLDALLENGMAGKGAAPCVGESMAVAGMKRTFDLLAAFEKRMRA